MALYFSSALEALKFAVRRIAVHAHTVQMPNILKTCLPTYHSEKGVNSHITSMTPNHTLTSSQGDLTAE